MKLSVLFRRDADRFCEGAQIITVVVEATGLAGFRDGAALIEQRFGQGDALCGDVFVDGIDIAKNPDMVRQKIGFLTSELKLEDFFTPNYLYDYFSALHKIEKTLSEQRKNYLFKKFGIEDFKEVKRKLSARELEFMDNISVKWLPEDINTRGEGSHNGNNYLAYTFYLENKGSDTINYWYEIFIDDVIKNVDDAIRVMVFRNDDKKIYAKPNKTTGEAENGTEKFYSSSEVLVEGRQEFKPGDIDRFTIVIFLEGDDPDCLDNLIGGEMKMHMDITEEHIKQK